MARYLNEGEQCIVSDPVYGRFRKAILRNKRTYTCDISYLTTPNHVVEVNMGLISPPPPEMLSFEASQGDTIGGQDKCNVVGYHTNEKVHVVYPNHDSVLWDATVVQTVRQDGRVRVKFDGSGVERDVPQGYLRMKQILAGQLRWGQYSYDL